MDNREEKRAAWHDCIRAYEASGLTQTAFCQERNIPLTTFSYHRTQYLAEQKKSCPTSPKQFIELHLPPVALEPFSLSLPNGIKLSLPQQFNEKQLAKLLEVLRTC